MTEQYRQTAVLIVLIALTIAFGLVVIPAGIGTEFALIRSSVTPRLVPQLATAGTGMALLYGLWELSSGRGAAQAPDAGPKSGGSGVTRALAAVVICFIFALWGFQWLGFYLGGGLMMLLLIGLLGEKHPVGILLVPAATVLAVYLVFELGFNVTLPRSAFLPGG